MNEKNGVDQFLEHINSHILPFIDYSELQASYDTDMVYAKGVLNRLHEAMVSAYGGETLHEESNTDRGFVVIPGVVRGRDNGKLALALLELDLSSSGEHWGTAFLSKYGIVAQNEKSNYIDLLKSEIVEVIETYIPYDYCYTATIPGDIHVNKARLPKELAAVLDDFRNHKTELLFEQELLEADAPTADTNSDVTDVRISKQEFDSKMRELLPDASDKALRQLINYADELDENGTHPKGTFFSETYVAYNLTARQYGRDIAGAVLKLCEESCLNPWEIFDAARLMEAKVPASEIIQKSIDGKLDLLPKQWEAIEVGLAALQSNVLGVPAAEKPSVREKIREAEKTPKKPSKGKHSQKKSEPEH